jgi:hypothetical protein
MVYGGLDEDLAVLAKPKSSSHCRIGSIQTGAFPGRGFTIKRPAPSWRKKSAADDQGTADAAQPVLEGERLGFVADAPDDGRGLAVTSGDAS